MAKRYFQNPYIGKKKNFGDVDTNFLKSNIQSIVSQIISKQKVKRHDDGGLYVGQGGIAYMLYFLHKKLPGIKLITFLSFTLDTISMQCNVLFFGRIELSGAG